MSIKTQLQAVLFYVNSKLSAKGAATAATVYGIGDIVDTMIKPQTLSWCQIPTPVKNYLDNVTYNPSDYTTSQIANYAPSVPLTENTVPVGKGVSLSAGTLERGSYAQTVSAGSATLYNDIPNKCTPFTVRNSGGEVLQTGTLMPNGGALRQIKCASAPNVRDLGGWACDGGTVKYGMLFRGGQPSANDREVLVNQCGVKYQLSLLGTGAETGTSVLGADVRFQQFSQYAWYTFVNKTELWKDILKVFFDCAKRGTPLYFHCAAGADRTGTVACVIEALLGMSQSDIDKDYELTSFYSGTGSDALARRRNESEWQGLISEINAFAGETFADRAASFVASLGFSYDEINSFRRAVINGNPSDLEPQLPPTNLLTMEDGLINYRIPSSGIPSTSSGSGYFVTDYFAFDYTLSRGFRIVNAISHVGNLFSGNTNNIYGNCKIALYDANKNLICHQYISRSDSGSAESYYAVDGNDLVKSDVAVGNHYYAFSGNLPSDWTTVKYIRLVLALNNAASAISSVSDVTGSNLAIYAE